MCEFGFVIVIQKGLYSVCTGCASVCVVMENVFTQNPIFIYFEALRQMREGVRNLCSGLHDPGVLLPVPLIRVKTYSLWVLENQLRHVCP